MDFKFNFFLKYNHLFKLANESIELIINLFALQKILGAIYWIKRESRENREL